MKKNTNYLTHPHKGENMEKEKICHPSHYNIGSIEVIDAIDDWKLNFSRGNAIKYIARAGHKDPTTEIEDLEKAKWYLEHEITRLKKEDKEEPVAQYIPYEESRAVCIQPTPYGAVANQGCTLKAHQY